MATDPKAGIGDTAGELDPGLKPALQKSEISNPASNVLLKPEQAKFATLAIDALVQRLGPKRFSADDFGVFSARDGSEGSEVRLINPGKLTAQQRRILEKDIPVMIDVGDYRLHNANRQDDLEEGEKRTFRIRIPKAF